MNPSTVNPETFTRSPVRVAAFAKVSCGTTGSSYTQLRLAGGQEGVLTLRLAYCDAPTMARSSSAGSPPNPLDGCYGHNQRGRNRIEPRTSKLTCRAAKAFLLILPNAVGTWPITVRNPVKKTVTRWICRIYPHADYPLEIRCNRGERYFEVAGVGRNSWPRG